MKELNIAAMIVSKRREKGITQEELASYFGVSKASVSKWETGQSYPDITFLPQLASYFNISVDELLGYEPQMEKEDIRRLYQNICQRFSKEPWDLVYADCQEYTHKYFSCFPLILQMGALYVNHFMLAPEPAQGQQMLQDAIALVRRVKLESKEPLLIQDALSLEACAYLMLQQPEPVLELLGEAMPPLTDHIGLMAQAWQMLGNQKKALECIQVSSYQHLIILMSSVPQFLTLSAGNPDHMEEILRRTLALINLFEIDQLHPNSSLLVYLTAAQIFCSQGKAKQALDMLKKYVDLGISISEFRLHGDNYFNAIEPWFEIFPTGPEAPRNLEIIRQSMVQGITQNPVFTVLESEPEYQLLIRQLTNL